MKELNKQQAIELAKSGWWKNEELSAVDIATLQLNQRLLCMDFGEYQKNVEKALGRSVWSHEFAEPQTLFAELKGNVPTPSFEDIFNKLPKEKCIIRK